MSQQAPPPRPPRPKPSSRSVTKSRLPERLIRNLGLITPEQQQCLLEATVLICGVGGMGGVCAEVLARMGIGHLILADPDVFEITNLNRQIHAHRETLGKNKAQVLAEEFRKIDPNLRVEAVPDGVTRENVDALLTPADIVVNAMDRMRDSLILERRARALDKPLVDAWLTPYASVFLITPRAPHWEEYLDLPTRGIPEDQLTPERCREAVAREVAYTFSHGIPYRYITPERVQAVVEDRIPRPSLAPVVWLSGVLMANEVFKYLVGLPTVDHIGVIYDLYTHQLLLKGGLHEPRESPPEEGA